MPPRSVIIVGAGLGGLTLAHALMGAGIEPLVLEREPGPSEVGAGISLFRNALAVLTHLGLEGPIRALAATGSPAVIANADGRVLSEVDVERLPLHCPAPRMALLHRRELQQALLDALPRGCVRFAAGVAAAESEASGATVVTTAGERLRAELVVGADGIGSCVRRAVVGDTPVRYAGYTCWRGVARAPAASPERVGELWGAGDRFGVVALSGHRYYWFAVANAPARSPVANPKAALRERFAHYAFGVPGVIEATAEPDILWNDIADRPPVRGWSRGHLTLLGDAIHATTPNLGQGAAMAMESAIVLTRALLAAPSVPQALAVYERTRAPRTAWVTTTSRRLGALAHLAHPLSRGLRTALMLATPASAQVRTLRTLLEYDATRAPLQGV